MAHTRLKRWKKQVQWAYRGIHADAKNKGNRLTGFELPVLLARRYVLRRQKAKLKKVEFFHRWRKRLAKAMKQEEHWRKEHELMKEKIKKMQAVTTIDERKKEHYRNWIQRAKNIHGEWKTAQRRVWALQKKANSIRELVGHAN